MSRAPGAVVILVGLLVVMAGCAPMAAAPASTAAPAAGSQPTAEPTVATPAAQPSATVAASTATAEMAPATAPAAPTDTPAAPAATLAPSAASTAEATSVSSGATATVNMQNYAFVPKNLTVAPGTTVVWINGDDTTHTVTADDRSYNSGDMAGKAEFRYTFSKAGVYSYYCVWHGAAGGQGMAGTITVK